MDVGGGLGDVHDGGGAGGEECRGFFRHLFVPVGELVGLGASLLDLFEEGVALGDDLVVAAEGAGVGAVDLREHDIEEAAAAGGGAFDELHVIGGEEDGGDGAEDIGGALGDAVEAEALGGDDAVRTLASDDVELDGDIAGGAGGLGDDAGDGLGIVALDDAPGDEVGVGRRALGASGGEEEDGFEDVGLALGVGAEEEDGAGGEVEGL